MMEQVDISALIPCLDEAENVVAITEAIKTELTQTGVSFEIIFIDNGSTDGTIELIKGLCAEDKRIRLIVNNRNFGQLRSPTYGIYQTSGRAVLGISADFQDPPAMIGDLIARWRAGARIVLAVRQSEDTSAFMRLIRAVGYGFLARFADYKVIPGATGFGVYDREVVNCLRQWRDPEPFFRGMLVESGFSLETIPYHRPGRAGGRSKNNVFTLLGVFLAGLASSSKGLLRVPLYVALAFALATLIGFVAAVGALVMGFDLWPPIAATALTFVAGLIFLFLGLIGEQVRLISDMVRNAPLVTEKERVNFDQDVR